MMMPSLASERSTFCASHPPCFGVERISSRLCERKRWSAKNVSAYHGSLVEARGIVDVIVNAASAPVHAHPRAHTYRPSRPIPCIS